jgi:hypothetical protein
MVSVPWVTRTFKFQAVLAQYDFQIMGESGVDVFDHLRDLRIADLELAQRIEVYLVDGTAGGQNRDVQSERAG